MGTEKKENIFAMIAVLTITCLLAGVCLAFTYNKTKDTIALAEKRAQLSSVKKVLPPFDGEPVVKKIIIDGEEKEFFVAYREEKIVGVATSASAVGYAGSVTILVGITTDETISGIALLQHQETPGLGAKAGSAVFLEQFKGLGLKGATERIAVKKDGGTINAITAATITSRAVANAATKALRSFEDKKKELIA